MFCSLRRFPAHTTRHGNVIVGMAASSSMPSSNASGTFLRRATKTKTKTQTKTKMMRKERKKRPKRSTAAPTGVGELAARGAGDMQIGARTRRSRSGASPTPVAAPRRGCERRLREVRLDVERVLPGQTDEVRVTRDPVIRRLDVVRVDLSRRRGETEGRTEGRASVDAMRGGGREKRDRTRTTTIDERASGHCCARCLCLRASASWS
eukprot:29797-Pelagococcus_subviridis.AAC.15